MLRVLLIVLLMGVLTMEYTNRIYAHSGTFYRAVALAIPVVLVAVSRASHLRWAGTIIASVYTVFMLGFEWILPLFPAEPKLGPVLNPVTYFVPPQFPLLFLIPAIALDLLFDQIVPGVYVSIFLFVPFCYFWPPEGCSKITNTLP